MVRFCPAAGVAARLNWREVSGCLSGRGFYNRNKGKEGRKEGGLGALNTDITPHTLCALWARITSGALPPTAITNWLYYHSLALDSGFQTPRGILRCFINSLSVILFVATIRALLTTNEEMMNAKAQNSSQWFPIQTQDFHYNDAPISKATGTFTSALGKNCVTSVTHFRLTLLPANL